MIILGINDGHSAGACVLRDGVIIAACEEERFTRRKNDLGFCPHAVEAVMAHAGICAGDIDHVAVSTRDLPYIAFALRKYPDWGVKEHLYEQEHYWKPKLSGRPVADYLEVMKDFVCLDKCFYDLSSLPADASPQQVRQVRRQGIANYLGVDPCILYFVDHHTCHAHHAYYSSPIRDDALVLTVDGFGDGCNASVGCVRNGRYERIAATDQCNLGRINALMTLLLSMKPAEEEYKVMGLAAYAKPHHVEEPYRIFRDTLCVDGLGFTYKNKVNDHYHYFLERLRPYRFDAIAGALQKYTEEILVTWCRNAVEYTGLNEVVIGGGVAQNIKACKAVGELDEVRNLYICPGAGDSSVMIGAAQRIYIEKSHRIPEPLSTAFLSTSFTEEDISAALEHPYVSEHFDVRDNVGPEEIADLLRRGQIVALMIGSSEFGPRALGHRSLIADPRSLQTVRRINETIKNRDFWMPFSPSILEERARDYLVNPKNLASPCMTMAFDSTELARRDIIAGLHPNDYTVRPQIVGRRTCPLYYGIIKAFERRTGVGAVLNTSFNIHGKPIVRTPLEAIEEVFTHPLVKLDYLLMNDTLLVRKTAGGLSGEDMQTAATAAGCNLESVS
jgi:carbamoyltransferase